MTLFKSLLGYKKILINQNQRGLVLNKGKISQIFTTGEHFIHAKDDILEMHTITMPEFHSNWKEIIINEEEALLKEHFHSVMTTKDQVALVYNNAYLLGIIAPNSRHLYWNAAGKIKVDYYDITEDIRIPSDILPILIRRYSTTSTFTPYYFNIPSHTIGIVSIDNKTIATLTSGVYAYWNVGKKVQMELVDLRLSEVDVSGQEIMTKDKVSIRVNLSFFYAVKDVTLALASSVKYQDTVYKLAQFTLREAIGTKTLDEILASKDELDNFITNRLQEQAGKLGLNVDKAGIKDVILPGEIRDMYNLVVKAERVAFANLVKRREETAATRSLLNTVKLMEDNPMLLRMKELETLEKLTEKVGSLTVFGGLEGIIHDVLKIKKL